MFKGDFWLDQFRTKLGVKVFLINERPNVRIVLNEGCFSFLAFDVAVGGSNLVGSLLNSVTVLETLEMEIAYKSIEVHFEFVDGKKK